MRMSRRLGICRKKFDGNYFLNGDQYERVTGGWSSDGYSYGANYTLVSGSVDDALNVATTAAWRASIVGTNNKVSLSNIDTLTITVESASAGALSFRVLSAKEANSATVKEVSVANKAGDLTIDVSDLSGEYYLALVAVASTTTYYISTSVSAVRGE